MIGTIIEMNIEENDLGAGIGIIAVRDVVVVGRKVIIEGIGEGLGVSLTIQEM